MFPVFLLPHGSIQQRLTFIGIFLSLFGQLDTEVYSSFEILNVVSRKVFQNAFSGGKVTESPPPLNKNVGNKATSLFLYKERMCIAIFSLKEFYYS